MCGNPAGLLKHLCAQQLEQAFFRPSTMRVTLLCRGSSFLCVARSIVASLHHHQRLGVAVNDLIVVVVVGVFHPDAFWRFFGILLLTVFFLIAWFDAWTNL